ncbi:WD40 repeat containing protein [Echinococcus multilocularis]|uniref:methylated diphthine methylhydrolase n=1 Tax=Echinococcus multilocularis TaxID=6211 RepID=A0A068YKD7_ECHMU|nr:WD40 repeat containing protein [Echinococcus multilocularis]
MSAAFSEIASYRFGLHTDSIELSPCGEQALVGSYELDETTGKRNGQLVRFEIDEKHVAKSYELKVPGVLDLCWMCSDLCLAAISSGELYTIFSQPSQPLTIRNIISVSQKLLLSADFHGTKAVTADETGNIYLVDYLKGAVISTCKAHEFESWCVRFSKNDDNLVLSGGDDCISRVWDQRVGFTKCTFSRRHEMGVCSLSSVPTHRHLISTGCFDEKLRIWDLRSVSGGGGAEVVVCHSEGGGVWRHKWSPCADRLIMACMHAGFAVLRVPVGLSVPSPDGPLAKPTFYRPSAKLAYGVDWHINAWADEQQHFEALLATCSFYDNCVSFAICTDSGA